MSLLLIIIPQEQLILIGFNKQPVGGPQFTVRQRFINGLIGLDGIICWNKGIDHPRLGVPSARNIFNFDPINFLIHIQMGFIVQI